MIVPPGVRNDVVTYRVVDAQGMVRGSALPETAAAERARKLSAEFVGSFTVERMNYVSFTHVEPIQTYRDGEAA